MASGSRRIAAILKSHAVEDLMTSDHQTIEGAQFSVVCPKCGTPAPSSVTENQQSIKCPGCGGGIDLTTDEAKHARQAAAAKASIQAHQGRS